MKATESPIFIGFKATAQEHQALAVIQKARRRHSKSDTLRDLILTEAEKILAKNNPSELIHTSAR